MTNRSRARWSLAVALAAHALALAWTFGRTPAGSTPQVLDERSLRTELEIAVEPAPPAATEAAPSEPAPPAGAIHVASRSAQPPHPSAPIPEASPSPVLSANPVDDGAWTFSPTRRSPQAAGASEAAAALNKATTSGIGAVLAEAEKKAEERRRKPLIFTPRDTDLGLVPGSQYVAIARNRVRNSVVPVNGHALLELWTDSRGIVARVRVLDPSSDPRAWEEVADALVEDTRAAFPLKIPSSADGLIITLDVTSALRTLSGSPANQGALSRVIGAVMDPADALLDSKATPQRVVSARVVGVEAF